MQAVKVDKLWNNYNDNKDKETKDQLIENYIPLVKHIASRMSLNLPSHVDYEDLISYGIFGLIQAIDRFDATKGVKFETYAYTRIKGSIIDELRRIDWVPQRIRKKAKDLQDIYANLEQSLARSVTDEDICKYLNISQEELNEIYKEVTNFTNVISFDDLIVFDDSLSPDIQIEKEEVKQILGKAIDNLPAQEKLVVNLYYYEGLNFKEIAEVMQLSQGRISQLHTKLILRLRGHLSRKRATF